MIRRENQENNPAKHQGGKSLGSRGEDETHHRHCGRKLGSEKERMWGPLSRASALRVSRYWEDMDLNVTVFLDKNGERKKVDVEKRIE